jgi:hypothetical protein
MTRIAAIPKAALLVAGLLACRTLAAQEEVPDWRARLSVHGYLNQAYAVSDEHPIFGIPTEGTTEYRDVALQFRYDHDRRNNAVVQFRHQRFGETRREADLVELDWAFYQRNVSDRLSLKAGRIPLPLGIFNEAEGAATTSPFFRPPNEFYDRHYTSKTLDGVLGAVSLGGPGGWTFDVDGYAGRWALDQWDSENQAEANKAFGAQVWANAPLAGVRVGAGAYRCEVKPEYAGPADYLMLHASVDADFDRWRVATEYLSGNLSTYGRYRAAYVQAGLQITRRVSLHGRGTVARIEIPINGHSVHTNLSEDLGISVNYAVHPSLLLKLEGHTNDGLLREDQPLNFYDSPSRTRYLIASVVASF